MAIFNETNPAEKTKFEALIKEADQNGDGELSLKEFKDLMYRFVNE